MFTDSFHMMHVRHAHRPAAIGGFDGAAFRGALPKSRRCSAKSSQLAHAYRATRGKRQAWRVCATLTTERPPTADTVWPHRKAHSDVSPVLCKAELNLAGYLVLRQSRFAHIRLFALQSCQAWSWEAACSFFQQSRKGCWHRFVLQASARSVAYKSSLSTHWTLVARTLQHHRGPSC